MAAAGAGRHGHGVVGPRPLHRHRRHPAARDGLEVFGAGLFLDPDLLDQGAGTLVEQAFAKSSILAPAQPLLGVHALLPVDEITLVAVPDAERLAGRELIAVDAPAVPAAVA